MKTAISIPDKVFKSAEELADRLGQSRSQLYTVALSSYLAQHRNEGVTERLNDVYQKTTSRVEPRLRTMQARSISKDEW